jgi:uncharacterized repeat protein (TIGR03847 family)
MPGDVFELNPVTHITVGAVGQPGQRTFFLQASQGYELVCLKLEKEQVFALARAVEEILQELEQREVRPVADDEEPPESELVLRQPVEPIFVVGQMGLVFDQSSDRIVLVVQELTAQEEADDAASARFWVSLGQMRALSRLAKEVVSGGRPICPLCQRPMDPTGHFCPRGNGHSKAIVEA